MLGKSQIKSDIFLQKNEPAASVFYTQITEQADEKKWILRDPSHCHIPYLIVGSVTDNSLIRCYSNCRLYG
jgi:hypothetical protein